MDFTVILFIKGSDVVLYEIVRANYIGLLPIYQNSQFNLQL